MLSNLKEDINISISIYPPEVIIKEGSNSETIPITIQITGKTSPDEIYNNIVTNSKNNTNIDTFKTKILTSIESIFFCMLTKFFRINISNLMLCGQNFPFGKNLSLQ